MYLANVKISRAFLYKGDKGEVELATGFIDFFYNKINNKKIHLIIYFKLLSIFTLKNKALFQNTMKTKVDSINQKILHILQKNARISVTELAKHVGLTVPAVSERIKKLEDTGIIQGYQAQVSYQLVGYQFKALITLKVFMGRLIPFLEKVTEYKEIINCYRVTGNENIILEVVFRNQKHLEDFIDRLITFGETKTYIVLSNKVENAPIQAL